MSNDELDHDDDHDGAPGPHLERLGETQEIVSWISGVSGSRRPSRKLLEFWISLIREKGFDVEPIMQDCFDDVKKYSGMFLFDMDGNDEILVQQTEDVEFEVALDSGCVQHV